jgi:branched-subunit amino acid transport protein AzlD
VDLASTSGTSIPWAALVPLAILAIALVVYCLVDLAHHRNTRGLPAWAWVLICLASIPFGAIVYLLFGRSEDR